MPKITFLPLNNLPAMGFWKHLGRRAEERARGGEPVEEPFLSPDSQLLDPRLQEIAVLGLDCVVLHGEAGEDSLVVRDS
ncbi:hypothetical protein B296_00047566 [Ensete ventricosum]|uniref:Uncharacterized protein n=1 Tax=Ensete ventricosum TaxID=4639 RepID=A0A426Y914_ENSVE|nr:hypothetical protein B296_00047566 [Ensete ventricosum]